MVDRALLHLFGELEARVDERDVDDGGRTVVGDHADAVGQVEQGRAQLHLVGVVVEGDAGLVELCVLGRDLSQLRVHGSDLGIEGGELCGSGTGLLRLRARGRELRESGFELRTAVVELRLGGIQLRATVGDLRLAVGELLRLLFLLLLRVERIDHARDAVEVFCAGGEVGDRLLLLVGERRPVLRAVDDRAGAAGGVRKLVGELIGHGAGCSAGDVEAVAQRAAQGEEGTDAEAEDQHPRHDHRPRLARSERTQTVEQ